MRPQFGGLPDARPVRTQLFIHRLYVGRGLNLGAGQVGYRPTRKMKADLRRQTGSKGR